MEYLWKVILARALDITISTSGIIRGSIKSKSRYTESQAAIEHIGVQIISSTFQCLQASHV